MPKRRNPPLLLEADETTAWEGGAAEGETELLAPPTVTAPTLAWSESDASLPVQTQRRVWPLVAVAAAAAALAGVVATAGSHWGRDDAAPGNQLTADATTTTTTTAPEVAAAPSTPAAALINAPAIAHLVPPAPQESPLITRDEAFLAAMRASGWTITNAQQMVNVAHQACFDLRRGATRDYVLAQLLATDPAFGMAAAVSFYSNVVAIYDCT
jgi:hypothetical protein